jgi:hypothetical protein
MFPFNELAKYIKNRDQVKDTSVTTVPKYRRKEESMLLQLSNKIYTTEARKATAQGKT